MKPLGDADLLVHLDVLTRSARAMCPCAHDAEDLVQETCARVLARPRAVAPEMRRAYLLTALRNTHRERLRTDACRPASSPLDDMRDVAAAAPAAGTSGRLEVAEAVSALPPEQRAAVVAVDVLGLSYGEAASRLGVPAGTVMSRLSRGRQRLQRTLAAPA